MIKNNVSYDNLVNYNSINYISTNIKLYSFVKKLEEQLLKLI